MFWNGGRDAHSEFTITIEDGTERYTYVRFHEREFLEHFFDVICWKVKWEEQKCGLWQSVQT